MTTSHGENDWKIRINGGEGHPVPHAHILFRDGSRVSVALDSLEILAGAVRPKKRIAQAVAWIIAHREELLAEYWRLNR
ncbi:MAG TPA: hypothetical protein DDY22_04185 [Geobacter sp.]|nr:hypothetical protein [Geobacter sp.]